MDGWQKVFIEVKRSTCFVFRNEDWRNTYCIIHLEYGHKGYLLIISSSVLTFRPFGSVSVKLCTVAINVETFTWEYFTSQTPEHTDNSNHFKYKQPERCGESIFVDCHTQGIFNCFRWVCVI